MVGIQQQAVAIEKDFEITVVGISPQNKINIWKYLVEGFKNHINYIFLVMC